MTSQIVSVDKLQSLSAKEFILGLCNAAKQQDRKARAKMEALLFSALSSSDEASVEQREAFVEEVRVVCENNFKNRYTVAKALYRARHFADAERLLSKPPELCSAKQLHLHARIAVQLGKIDVAMGIWNRVIAQDPDFIPAINEMLSLYRKSNDEGMISEMTDRLEAAQDSAVPGIFDLCALTVFEPWRQLVRVGGKNDGGYLIMDQVGGYDCFLSGGVGAYVTFEEQFCAAHNVDCHSFDPTVEMLPSQDERIHFYKKGIGGVNSETMTNLSGHLESCKNAFVKMDVEGSEYNWIESLSDEHLRNIKQIVLEWHSPLTKRRLACIARLAKTHVLVHVHPNNVRQSFRTIAGVDIPGTFETTFVRKEPSRAVVPNSVPLPHPLDAPNVVKNPEVRLAWWPFAAQYREKPKANQFVATYLSNSCGLGDFLLTRCRWWATFCAQKGIEFKINFSNHPHLGLFLKGDSTTIIDRKHTVGEGSVHERMAGGDVVYGRFSGKGIPRAVQQDALSPEALLEHFAPTSILVDAVKKTMAEMAIVPDSFVSVHVRCGDAYMANPRVASDKRWNDEWWLRLSEIAERYRDETVLIHCDSSEVKGTIVEKYGWRSCIKSAPHHFGITAHDAVASDDVMATLIELYIMSLSKEVRPVSRSNFSTLGGLLRSHRRHFLG